MNLLMSVYFAAKYMNHTMMDTNKQNVMHNFYDQTSVSREKKDEPSKKRRIKNKLRHEIHSSSCLKFSNGVFYFSILHH